ncbi:hypothetical protein ACH5RR_031210 [Cinchona calisaya]|uniref:BSD domain-containing protein n=1 Tax=Cinchona calisaya TaxID=153742 RepID=A0ABD2YEJ3_9GENT
MDFFRSVFSEDPSPPSSPTSSGNNNNPETTPTSPVNSQSQNPNPNPNFPSVTNSWTTFGSSFLKSVASKSESVIGNYRRDLEEFRSNLKKETAIIREAASRAVKDLPDRLESGAAVAQTSLESVGQVIDNLGGAVSEIIIHGKDSIFNADDVDNDGDYDAELVEISDNSNKDEQNVKPYSRFDALIRAVQCDIKTYCVKPEDEGEYLEWKDGFLIEERVGEIEDLVKENGVIGELYNEVVPVKVDHETFWSRYFYRVYRVKKAEEARVKLVKRAIEGEEEEELSWDVDDDDKEDENNGFKSREELKGELEENEKKLENLHLEQRDKGSGSGNEKKLSVSEVKGDVVYDERDSVEGRLEEAKSDKGSSEGRNDNISDFSLVSSQRSSHEEEEIGWDEIEDIGSDDGTKVAARGSPNIVDLRKQLSAAETEEELSWDAEDDDPAKS